MASVSSAGSFIPNSFDCVSPTEINFFHSGSYTNASFSLDWATRETPFVDGFDRPVYELVLDQFNIPMSFPYGTPEGGTLPGMNINRMPAVEAIRLSLAESLVKGEWWDVYEDGLGGVYFQQVFSGNGVPPDTIQLDVRFCVATSSKSNKVDMVVVTGYDFPPTVEVRDFQDVVPTGLGEVNPASLTGTERLFTVSPSDLLEGTRFGNTASNTVYKSYADPVITDIDFQGQAENPFYDVTAFEKILGYVVDIDGMPADDGAAASVTYSFSETTYWYQEHPVPSFTEKPGDTVPYMEAIIEASTPLYSDRYGTSWPLYVKPSDIVFTGNKILSSDQVPIPSLIAFYWTVVNPVKEFVSMSAGSSWTWRRPTALDYELDVYFVPDAIYAALDLTGLHSITFKSDTTITAPSKFAPIGSTIGYGGGFGYLIDKMFIGWEVDRPSVKVEDANGDAATFAADLRVRYAPIIQTDPPAPIAYKYGDAVEEVDQSTALFDTDPTTCQNVEETDVEIMNELMQGNVMSLSLPFCESARVCGKVAATIYDYMNYQNVQTYSITCGPDAMPRLGVAVSGFPTNLRIDSINYSFQDGSSYTIEVTLSPVFSSVGSWTLDNATREMETVTRPAVVTWSAGDGTNYRVDVKGLGSFYAANGVTGANRIFYPGEIVDVTVYNVPKEK
jgi:hypothetical protein